MTVVDASVLVAALVDNGDHGAWAESVIAAGSLCAPELLLTETMNVLRRLERAHLISAPEANGAQDDLMHLEIELFPVAPLAERIWALRHNLTCYDAWYVSLAEALHLPLATLDATLNRSTGATCKLLTPHG